MVKIEKILALPQIKQKQVLSKNIFMTEDYYKTARSNEYYGYCTRCQYEQSGCEPDAENYTCEECSEETIQGIDNLLVCGHLYICEESEPLMLLAEKFGQKVYY